MLCRYVEAKGDGWVDEPTNQWFKRFSMILILQTLLLLLWLWNHMQQVFLLLLLLLRRMDPISWPLPFPRHSVSSETTPSFLNQQKQSSREQTENAARSHPTLLSIIEDASKPRLSHDDSQTTVVPNNGKPPGTTSTRRQVPSVFCCAIITVLARLGFRRTRSYTAALRLRRIPNSPNNSQYNIATRLYSSSESSTGLCTGYCIFVKFNKRNEFVVSQLMSKEGEWERIALWLTTEAECGACDFLSRKRV